MDKLRAELAARYRKAPEEDKPKVQLCSDCGKSIYDHKVCPFTGRLHQNKNAKLIGGSQVDSSKRTFTAKELVAAIDSIRVRWHPAKTQHVKVDVDSINIFQSFVLSRDWKQQRAGILYGTTENDGDVVTIHSIYEPEQTSTETDFEMLNDPREEKVDQLAAMFGWKRVGLICSHPPRDQEEVVLSGKELLLLARDQSRFGAHCVLITVSPSETGHIHAQAWQASEQCVNLFQIGLLHDDEDNLGCIRSTEPLEIAQDESDAKGTKKCIIKEPSKSVDTRWMTAYIAIEQYQSPVLTNRFIRISRAGEAPPTFENLSNYFRDPKRSKLPFVEKIADFHVLVFLMEMFLDIKTDMPVVVESILTKDNARLVEYENLVKSAM